MRWRRQLVVGAVLGVLGMAFPWMMQAGDLAQGAQRRMGIIEGLVTDASTEEPIPEARVSVGSLSIRTDARGSHTTVLPEDTYDVTVSKFGYLPQTVRGVSVTAGLATAQDFSLRAVSTSTFDGTVYDDADAGWPLAARIDAVASDPAGNQTVFTDPETGYYSVELVDGETYDVTASAPGYVPDTQPVTVAGVPITLDFHLLPDGSCTAPGYSPRDPLIDEDFEAGVAPAGWTVIDNASSGPVWTDLAGCGESGNFTNGSGEAACASSADAGNAEFDTELWTPLFDLTAEPVADLYLSVNYQNNGGSDFFEIDLSTDGGVSWPNNLLSWNEDHGSFRAPPGEDVAIDLLAAGATGSNNLLRFHYFDPNTGDEDLYVQIDDVLIHDSTCNFDGGGIFYGYVTKVFNGEPVNGVVVEADVGSHTVSRQTPQEENLGDGYYYLWVPDTTTALTASSAICQPVTQSVTAAATATRQDFALCVGEFIFTDGFESGDTTVWSATVP